MVGVPGRSKACTACRQRKISCDQRKPECGECVRSNRKCDFTKKHVFVLNQEGTHKTVYRRTTSAQKEDDRAASVVHNTQANALVLQPSSGALTQQQLVSNVISLTSATPRTNEFPEQTWTINLSAFAGSPDPRLSSSLACWFAYNGRRAEDPVPRQFGRQLYLRGLSETSAALRLSSTALDDETLASCLALAMYETLECPNETLNGYRWHRDGCMRLIQLRGVDRHKTGIGHQLFLNARFHGVVQAFEQRCASYLLSDEWMTLPWEFHPKGEYDRLVDIFARGPRILGQADSLPSMSLSEAAGLVESMWKDCWEIDKDLQSFLEELQSAHPGPLFWEESLDEAAIGGIHDMSDSLYTTGIHFQDPDVARMLTLLWAFQAMLWAGLLNLYKVLRPGAKQVPLLCRSNGETMHWLDAVRNVCKSFYFCTRPKNLDSGRIRVAASLNIIIDVMKYEKGCQAEYDFAVAAKKELGRRWISIMKYSTGS